MSIEVGSFQEQIEYPILQDTFAKTNETAEDFDTKPDRIFRAKIAASEAKFDKALQGVPKEQWHLLFIDCEKWKQIDVLEVDTQLFDNTGQPGYYRAMIKTWEFIRHNLNTKMDAQQFCNLHDMCVNKVYTDIHKTDFLQKGYAPEWAYDFKRNEMSVGACQECVNEKILDLNFEKRDQPLPGYLAFFSVKDEDTTIGKVCSSFLHPDELPAVHGTINGLFEKYYTSIELAQSNEQKLEAIAKLCRALQIFHVFPDGNGRTILFALLPKLLIENGFSPAILEDVNIFNGYHETSNLVTMIQEGIQRYERLVAYFNWLKITQKST